VIAPVLLLAQVHQDLFARIYGGRNDDWVYSIVACSDGGFALAGYTRSFGSDGADFLLLKLNPLGELEWALTAGEQGSEYANALAQTADGGFALAGYTRSFGAGGSDILVVKLNQDGELGWARTIGGTGNECAYSIAQLPDGSLLLAGYTTSFGSGGSDILLLEMSEDGDLRWAKTIGGPGSESASFLALTNEGGFFLAGYGQGVSGTLPLVIRLDPSAGVLWAKSFSAGEGSYIRSAIAWMDGYLLAGWVRGKGSDPDALVVRLNEKGGLVWARAFGGKGYDWASCLTVLPGGGFGLAGCISFGHYNFLIMGLSGAGELEWAKTFGSPGWDAASCMAVSRDQRIAVAGYTSGFGIGGDDILLLELSPDGEYPGCAVDCPVRIRAPSVRSQKVSVESKPCFPAISSPELTIRKVPVSAVDVCAPPLPDQ